MDDFQYEYILIRYGELTTKGKNKKDFIKRLADNMKQALSSYKDLVFERTRDHTYIHLNGTDPDLLIPTLKNVFGIRSFSKAGKTNNDIDEIINATVSIMQNKTGTFKVNTRRANKNFPMHSDEINRKVASVLLNKFSDRLKVDVHKPDYEIIIEIREHNTYIMPETILGNGGYPVGVAGKGLLMLSGGIDSPVAGYLAMKRGVTIECIHYASMPYTSQAAIDKVKVLAASLASYQGKIMLHIVPFTELQLEIYKHVDEPYAITIMRRMMYRIAQQVATTNNCLAIINGESISQVASQTLNSMDVINKVCDIPVIRPVVTYDKLEIIDLAKKIDTYETSILPYEDCCTIFAPKAPQTKPKLSKCEMFEAWFDYASLIQTAVEKTESVIIDPSYNKDQESYL